MLKSSGVLKKERINKITKLKKKIYVHICMYLVEWLTVLRTKYEIYSGC